MPDKKITPSASFQGVIYFLVDLYMERITLFDKLTQKIDGQEYKIMELEGKLNEAIALNSWLSSRIESLERN